MKDEVSHACPQAVSWGVLLGFCLLSVKWSGDERCVCAKGEISK